MKAPILGVGIQGKSSNVNSQRRINMYYDVQKQADKATVSAYPTPGFETFSIPSSNVTRGMYWMESTNSLFVVQRSILYEVAFDGVATNRGSLDFDDISGAISMSDNGTQLCIVTGPNGYIYTPATTTLTKITDPDFPGGDTVCFLDSFFIVNKPNSGQFYKSASNDGLSWNALEFATAESFPDNLVAVVADKGNLVLFGALSTELWANTGAVDFPFQRIQGAASQEGLAARWSLSRVGGAWVGVFRNRQGQYTFGRLNGYSIESISTPDLDFLLNGYANPENAVAFSYTMAGHAFYQVSFPSDNVTWLYDASTVMWSQLQGNGLSRSKLSLGCAFGTLLLGADYQNGTIYSISQSLLTENGLSVPREIVGGHIFSGGHLNLMRVQRVRLDAEGGVGAVSGQGALPTVSLQISRDGGHTWGSEMWTTFGRLGQYRMRAEWRRIGQARDYVFKIRLTDPVKFVLIDAYMEATESRA